MIPPSVGTLSPSSALPSGRLLTHTPSRGSWLGRPPSPAGPPVLGAGLIQSHYSVALCCSPWTLLLKHQLCRVLFKAFKTSQSATLPPSSRFRGGPRTRGAGPSSHLGRQVTRPVWALTAPGRSPPFMPDCSTSVSSLGFSLLWGLWEACCHPSSQHPGGTGHCHCPRSQRDWPRWWEVSDLPQVTWWECGHRVKVLPWIRLSLTAEGFPIFPPHLGLAPFYLMRSLSSHPSFYPSSIRKRTTQE